MCASGSPLSSLIGRNPAVAVYFIGLPPRAISCFVTTGGSLTPAGLGLASAALASGLVGAWAEAAGESTARTIADRRRMFMAGRFGLGSWLMDDEKGWAEAIRDRKCLMA